jgi:hypothetical protein
MVIKIGGNEPAGVILKQWINPKNMIAEDMITQQDIVKWGMNLVWAVIAWLLDLIPYSAKIIFQMVITNGGISA